MNNTKKIIKRNFQSGQVSKILIVLMVIIFVVIVIIYGATKFFGNRVAKNSGSISKETIIPEIPKPVYEITLGDTKFLVELYQDLGSVLKSPTSYESDLTTTERFIKVTVGAQNKGKNNVAQYSWDVGNIVDSDGRNFVSINDKAYSHLPKPDLCGALLKPEFKPVPCIKYYEVSKASKDLKVVVKITEPKKQEALLDLKK